MNPAAHSFAAGIFVRAGSRDEPAAVNGVSHFLEHMMFKGSSRLDWQAMNRVFDEMGARYNAFTTQEMTAYYGSVLPTFTTPLLKHCGNFSSPRFVQMISTPRRRSFSKRSPCTTMSRAEGVREADGRAF